jgi:hypothetical protein
MDLLRIQLDLPPSIDREESARAQPTLQVESSNGRGTFRSLSCYAYWLVSNMARAPWATVHVLHPSTSSTMIPFSTCFISFGHFFQGRRNVEFADWRSNGRWWYTLAHVCQRWRNIILGSTTYLGLSLLCTYGTPVADMLAHSPPLPLVVGYFRNES